jgi:hypothetical protein
VSNNIHNIPCLESVELEEQWVEEEKIPIKKDTTATPTTQKEDGDKKTDTENKEGQA